MAQLLREQQQSTKDLHKFLELDLSFHQALAEAVRNRPLVEVLRLLVVELWQTRLSATARSFRPVRTLREHLRIVEAIQRRDPEAARRAMLAHLATVERSAKLQAKEVTE